MNTLYPTDIYKVGHTIYSDSGNACFACHLITANIEELILREILKLFGEYEILHIDDGDNGEIIFTTNLPYNKLPGA